MLIEFTVENFRSFRDEATFSLVASPGDNHRDTNVVSSPTVEGVRSIPTLRSAAIYGANGAGKTNLLQALGAMVTLVSESARGLDESPIAPFLFDPTSVEKPTRLEAMFVGDDRVRYQFGFKATSEAVVREWLYAWPRGRVQKWYERHGARFDFGARLTGDREVWRRATRPDALYLSTAIGLNSEQLQPAFNWFDRNLRVSGFGGWSPAFSFECCGDERKDDILSFLRSADMAISDLTITKEQFDPDTLPDGMPAALRETIKEDLKGAEIPHVRITHESDEGVSGELDLEEESDGTQKMFALAGPWMDALKNGYVIAFDELHDNLHPNLVRHLVNSFHDPVLNQGGAQLIFSTHETSILSQDVFRRDQIWFCERDSSLATTLYPLSDFKPRRGVTNIERAYLAGRFGALPYATTERLHAQSLGK